MQKEKRRKLQNCFKKYMSSHFFTISKYMFSHVKNNAFPKHTFSHVYFKLLQPFCSSVGHRNKLPIPYEYVMAPRGMPPLRRPPPSTEGIWLWLRWPWGRWCFFLFLWLLKLSVSFCSFFFLSYHHHIVSLSVIPSSRSSPFPTSRFLNMSDVFFF